jgi:hypothetical protein
MAKNDEMYGCAVLGVVILTVFILAKAASYSPKDGVVEDSRNRGAAAGQEDGFRAGEVDGIRNRNEAAYDAEYARVVDEARTSGEYLLVPMYCFVILIGCAAAGYLTQFAFFYSLRRAKVLQDVDRILMPPGSTVADLEVRQDA